MKKLTLLLFATVFLGGCQFKFDVEYFHFIDLNPPPPTVSEEIAANFDMIITGLENQQTLDDDFSLETTDQVGTLAFFNSPVYEFNPVKINDVVQDPFRYVESLDNFWAQYTFTIDSADETFVDTIRYSYEGPLTCTLSMRFDGLWNGDEEILQISIINDDSLNTTKLTCEVDCELADQSQCDGVFNYGLIKGELEIKIIDNEVDLTATDTGITDSDISFLLKAQDVGFDVAGFPPVGLQHEITMSFIPK